MNTNILRDARKYLIPLGIGLTVTLVLFCRQPVQRGLKFMHIYDAMSGPQGRRNVEWIDDRIREFQAKHPEIPIAMEQVKWDHIDMKSMADYRAGVTHDVVLGSPQLLTRHARVGDLVDLNAYLAWSDSQIADFAWNPVWAACEQDGQRLGIPMGAHTRLCVYRRDWFQQAGLDPDQPPRTLEELVATAKKLTRDLNGDGKIDVWGLGIYFGPSRATIELTFAPVLWHFGGELWDPISKQAVFASAAGVQAAQFLYDLLTKHQVTPRWALSGTYEDVILHGFFNEKLAMAWGWGSYWIQPLAEKGWITNCFPPTPQCEMSRVGVFVTPTTPQAQFTNTWIVSVHTLSQQPQSSVQFLETLVEPEALLTFPDAGLPTLLSAWQRPEYQSDFYRNWFEAVRRGRSMPKTAHYNELANSVAAALQEIMVRNAPIEPTLRRFQQVYNARYGGE